MWEGLEVRGQGVDGIFDGWRKGRKKNAPLKIVKNGRINKVFEKQNRLSERSEIVKICTKQNVEIVKEKTI